MNSEIREQLQELEIEDLIWIILIFASIMAIISNYFEREWVKKKTKKDYQTFKNINTTILIVSFLVYFYFVLLSYKKYCQTKGQTNLRKIFFSELNLFTASLFLVGGLLNIFIETNSNVGDANMFLL